MKIQRHSIDTFINLKFFPGMTILKTRYYYLRRWLVLRCNKQEYENHLMITYCTKKENEQRGGDQRKKFLRLIIKCNYRILGSEWRLYKDSIYYWIHAFFCFMEKIWNVLSLQKFSLRILFCLDIFDGRETMYREGIHTQRRWIRNISQPQKHRPINTLLVNICGVRWWCQYFSSQ